MKIYILHYVLDLNDGRKEIENNCNIRHTWPAA